MSVPNSFYKRHIDGQEVEQIEMLPIACSDLFHFLYPKFETLSDDIASWFYVAYICETWGVDDLPENAKQYMQAYHWIMQACDEIDSLTPYKDALNKALRADPRFQEKQAD